MEKESDPAAAGMNLEMAVAPSPSPQKKSAADPLKKERHIVTWTPQEDDLLREQVALHGTDNWTSIAVRFKDKTGRQCRRRWNTYLNSECKKGGWSPEEDMLLCEAQKIFGNRWTEIAKVVSGRTDNAVKNRFTTLCKKRTKQEALSKENNVSRVNTNNKRVMIQSGCSTSWSGELGAPVKQMRYHISDVEEKFRTNEKFLGLHTMEKDQLRPPLSVLVQNFDNMGALGTPHHASNNKTMAKLDVSNKKTGGTFLRRDDPKLTALLQQAELLSSLALKVNSENTNQSLEDAWKELQEYLIQTADHGDGVLKEKDSGMDCLLDDFKDLIEDLKSKSLRRLELPESSQGSSECSNGSTHPLNSLGNKGDHQIEDRCLQDGAKTSGLHDDVPFSSPSLSQGNEDQNKSDHQIKETCLQDGAKASGLHEDGPCSSPSLCHEAILLSPQKPNDLDDIICNITTTEFTSPLQMVPPFQSFTEGIASPKFTASERHFLQSVLGLSSPGPSPNFLQPPTCKRALLDSLSPS